MARLIIVTVTEGEDIGLEFDGEFHPWESVAALQEAIGKIAEREEQEHEEV